jgi:hypothetical protein
MPNKNCPWAGKHSVAALLCFLFSFLAIGPSGASPAEVAEPLPQLPTLGEATARYAGLIRVYDAELRAPRDISRRELLSPEVPKCLSLRYRVSLRRDQLIEAADRTLARQLPAAALLGLREPLERWHDAYQDVDPGDRYTLCVAGGVTQLWFNGVQTVQVEDPRFARAYLGIWLAESPLSTALRDALLEAVPES